MCTRKECALQLRNQYKPWRMSKENSLLERAVSSLLVSAKK